jgi:imidazolonepropionase-like amidohydrolase
MRSRALRFFLLAALCASIALAQERPKSANTKPGSPIYITHVTVIDTETGKEAPDRTVIISGDRISEVRNSKDVKPASGAKVVDGKGKYLISGCGICMCTPGIMNPPTPCTSRTA